MKFFNNNNKINKKMVVSHITDPEGNLRYFEQWAARSKYLKLERGKLVFTDSSSHQKLVCGGDIFDKGKGDLRIAQILLKFKEENPSDVILIAGNREIKYRRLTYELLSNSKARLLYGSPALWKKTSEPRDYLIKHMQPANKNSISIMDMVRQVAKMSVGECQTLYLKWMLEQTMGCGPVQNKPGTFEYRRMELADMGELALNSISDEQVTQSFIDSVLPDGLVAKYLKVTQLGHIIGETLFIHGAVTPDNMGYVPGMSETDARMDDAAEWIEALNHWYANEISSWLKNPVENGWHSPGYKPLDQYVLFNQPKSIVNTNWYQKGKLAPIPDKVVNFLNKVGIYRVVTGHQPFADFPLIIRNPNLEIIVGDTGYSDPSAVEDTRGQAIHNLDIIQWGGRGYASIDAVFKDGSSLFMDLPSRTQVSLGNDFNIGHFIDGQLIRPLNGSQLGCSKLDGHNVINEKWESKGFELPNQARFGS